MKKIYILLIISMLISLPLTAQIFPSSPANPVVDGSFGTNEYPEVVQLKDLRLGYAQSRDSRNLHFILEAPTTGWVSVGLGSSRMHGAHIIIGYDAVSSQVISEETGRGHSHSPSSSKILVQSKIKETAEKTTLEFTVPASEFDSGRNLRLIIAYGNQDNLRSKHVTHASHTIIFLK